MIYVKVSPGASKDSIEHIKDNEYKVKCTAPAVDGKANDSVINILSNYFKVKKTNVDYISGRTSRHKYFFIHKE
jgi:hypothetical protein